MSYEARVAAWLINSVFKVLTMWKGAGSERGMLEEEGERKWEQNNVLLYEESKGVYGAYDIYI